MITCISVWIVPSFSKHKISFTCFCEKALNWPTHKNFRISFEDILKEGSVSYCNVGNADCFFSNEMHDSACQSAKQMSVTTPRWQPTYDNKIDLTLRFLRFVTSNNNLLWILGAQLLLLLIKCVHLSRLRIFRNRKRMYVITWWGVFDNVIITSFNTLFPNNSILLHLLYKYVLNICYSAAKL